MKNFLLAPFKGGLLGLGNAALSLTSGALAATMITYSSFVLYDSVSIQNQARSSAADILRYRPTVIESDDVPLSALSLGALSEINDDYRAWLTLDDTGIDYPVMQGPNDLYYAAHDIYKKSSLTGAIYMATANSPDFTDSYNLLYGHHMDGGIMFGALDRYLEPEYLEAHRSGVLASTTAAYDLRVFVVVKTDAYERMFYNAGNRMEAVADFLRNPKETTEVAFFDEAALSDARQIIAFSTCASATTNGRLVVLATMSKREAAPDPDSFSSRLFGDDYGADGGSSRLTSPKTRDPNAPPESASLTGSRGIPVSGDIPGNPVSGDIPGNPASGDIPGNPVSGDVSGNPASGDIPGNPASGDIPGNPVSGDVPESPDEADASNVVILTPGPTVEIDDAETPLARFSNRFQPRGVSYGGQAWALVNLIALLMTAYLFLPLTHIKAKYCRAGTMKKINRAKESLRTASELEEEELAEKSMIFREAVAKKARAKGESVAEALRVAESESFADVTQDEFADAVETLFYQVRKFVRRFRVGVALELLLVVIAAIAFVLTEDMRLPMILIDKWTPLMLLFLLLCWIADIFLARYRPAISPAVSAES